MSSVRSLIFVAVIAALTFSPCNAQLVINEVDSNSTGTDLLEFVELYSSTPNMSLDGYIVVFYNGSGDISYATFDLNGFFTDANGYFLLGNTGVVPTPSIIFPSNGLQNGADAVALYFDLAANFPTGTAVTAANLIDAVVYDNNNADDTGLINVLTPGEPQINENGNGAVETESIGRCADGLGGALVTSSYVTQVPTPGAANLGPCATFENFGSQDIPNCGPIIFGVSGANPGAELYNLVSVGCTFGNGPLLGVGLDAWQQLFLPLGIEPFHVLADINGDYLWTFPTACLSGPVTVEVVSVEVSGFTILNVSSTTCFQISI
ncbi:MAG TPA: hypothetical protein PKA37_04155 [Planctomycetota bacterium]|jgi:hypothetical protein|nr:hypothetical protein [Planctomycetota bacterium]